MFLSGCKNACNGEIYLPINVFIPKKVDRVGRCSRLTSSKRLNVILFWTTGQRHLTLPLELGVVGKNPKSQEINGFTQKSKADGRFILI